MRSLPSSRRSSELMCRVSRSFRQICWWRSGVVNIPTVHENRFEDGIWRMRSPGARGDNGAHDLWRPEESWATGESHVNRPKNPSASGERDRARAKLDQQIAENAGLLP